MDTLDKVDTGRINGPRHLYIANLCQWSFLCHVDRMDTDLESKITPYFTFATSTS